jgi:sugar/nucleoside kinase (ribokinase family)
LHAGVLFALLRGAPLALAGRLGNALGALATTRPGAADALPTRADLSVFLELHGATRELEVLSSESTNEER